VMEAVGRPVEDVEGLSLWPLLGPGGPARAQRAHELANRTVFAHRRRERLDGPPRELWSAIHGDWRLIADHGDPNEPRFMLFDHAHDPKETTDRSTEHPDVVQALTEQIDGYRARPAGHWERRKLELSEQERAELEAIGYVEP